MIYQHFNNNRIFRITPNNKLVNNSTAQNGACISTRDAYTITDGPAIFIAQDVDKIGKFCIQQANIPSAKMNEISETIVTNNVIKEKMMKLEN